MEVALWPLHTHHATHVPTHMHTKDWGRKKRQSRKVAWGIETPVREA